MSRSGSMWVFNVVRALFSATDHQVLPSDVPRDEISYLSLAHQALSDPDPGRKRWVFKVHSLIGDDVPGSKFITTERDLRDVLISFMRFMNCTFETALQAAVDSMAQVEHYRRFPEEILLTTHYAQARSKPARTVQEIAKFLGLEVSNTKVNEILDRFSKDNVRRMIERKESDVNRRINAGEAIGSSEIVEQRFSNGIRVFDASTGFQSGHITDYRDGDWRQLLSADQIARINAILGPWLVRNGYEPE